MTSPDHAGNSSKKRVSSFNPQDIVPNPKKSPQRHVSSYIKHLLDEFRRSPTLTSKPKGRMKPLNITSVTDSGSTGHPSTPPKDMFHGEMVIFLLSALNGILIWFHVVKSPEKKHKLSVICEERIFVQSGIECGCNGIIMQLELNRIRCRLNPVPRPLRVSQTNRLLLNQMVVIGA